MAKQSEESKKNFDNKLLGGVTQEQLDEWKAKYGRVYIITVKLEDGDSLTGYFKKPIRDIMANCINLASDKKLWEAKEFLMLNTFIGGDSAIKKDYDAAFSAQTKLWAEQNFLIAEATKY